MEGAEEFCLPLGAQGCRLGCAAPLMEGLVGADDGEQDRVTHLVRVRVRLRVKVGVGVGVRVGEGWG